MPDEPCQVSHAWCLAGTKLKSGDSLHVESWPGMFRLWWYEIQAVGMVLEL